MDIHKPKAAHSWREFLIEIGTIVCGILIALALEQGVEALRERRAAAEAREGIRDELANDFGQLAIRERNDGCVKARLAEIEALIHDWSAQRPVPQPLWLGRPTTWEIKTARFQSDASTGRTSLLPPREQSTYATVYAHLRTYMEAQERERPAWARLQLLESSPPFDPLLRAELLLSLQEAKYDRARAASAIRQIKRDAAALKIEPDRSPEKVLGHMQPACIPLHTPRAQALELFYGAGDRSADP